MRTAYDLLDDPAFRRASALARCSLDGLREDLLSLGRGLLASATPDYDRIWHVTAWAMDGLRALRVERRELDAAARSANWDRAAACTGVADTASARLLQACIAAATAARAPGPAMDQLAEAALRQGVPPALEDLWGRLRSPVTVREE